MAPSPCCSHMIAFRLGHQPRSATSRGGSCVDPIRPSSHQARSSVVLGHPQGIVTVGTWPLASSRALSCAEVLSTPTHLAIVMEYAAGGELFARICSAGRFSEDEARFFFQQLISGVSYCHSMEICHRDLKLENTLLDGSPTPRLKICDFGYSKSALLHSQPKSTVGTPAYIAPEVLSRKEYDGKIADVWSCGVTLYVMLVGAYPFEDPEDPRNFRKTIGRIMSVQYSIPDYVRVSADCRQLLSRIFVANPSKRITIPEIKQHPWFLKSMPKELIEGEKTKYEESSHDQPLQSVEEIMRIIQEAKTPGQGSKSKGQAAGGSLDPDDLEFDVDSEIDLSGDFVNHV
ncbi:hypothetical protein RHMOL_Rhmol11G0045500 [Rhododendron molle]|uniref:Uncharacterized protein n=1 Tax=Rhododendron molle TaxID=49168 RepID=A0ACC0LPQ4_RHOML|nr:hypothetical protein RHMOL_Rhmol11G0045500 [Rhododendron molle]